MKWKEPAEWRQHFLLQTSTVLLIKQTQHKQALISTSSHHLLPGVSMRCIYKYHSDYKALRKNTDIQAQQTDLTAQQSALFWSHSITRYNTLTVTWLVGEGAKKTSTLYNKIVAEPLCFLISHAHFHHVQINPGCAQLYWTPMNRAAVLFSRAIYRRMVKNSIKCYFYRCKTRHKITEFKNLHPNL